jgi:hypothetical protein
VNKKTSDLDLFGKNENKHLPPCHLSAAHTVPVSIRELDISFPGIYDSGFNKILGQKATRVHQKKRQLSTEHRKVSETQLGVLQKRRVRPS